MYDLSGRYDIGVREVRSSGGLASVTSFLVAEFTSIRLWTTRVV